MHGAKFLLKTTNKNRFFGLDQIWKGKVKVEVSEIFFRLLNLITLLPGCIFPLEWIPTGACPNSAAALQ